VPVKTLLIKHRELLRFAVVGGISFLITVGVNYGLKLTVLGNNPLTAQAIGVLIATIFSYVASREWSFDTRGGRERQHEAALFFILSAVALGLNEVPLALSHYLLGLRVPNVGRTAQEIADFVSGMIFGTLLGTVFRYWSFKKWVFPQADARPRVVQGGNAIDPDIQGEKAA
jgi:putative flippase GtrA